MNEQPELDLIRYPLHRPESAEALAVARAARQQFTTEGICALPGFLRPDAAADMASAVLGRIDRMCSSDVVHDIYQHEGPDPALPADHPRNRRVRSRCLCLPDDEIPAGLALRDIYEWAPLNRFVSAVVSGPVEAPPPLYRLADPLGALTVNVLLDGHEVAWHFDQARFVVILLLQGAEEGGAYEVAPESRWGADGSPDYALHRRVLDGAEPSVLRHRFAPGTLVLHRGTHSLHRVAPVAGARPRVSALLSYSEVPGATLSPEVRRAYYGRTAARGPRRSAPGSPEEG